MWTAQRVNGSVFIYARKGGENLKSFELAQSEKNGKRRFKAILHEIYPDSCIDKKNGVGTMYNENGITWIRSYCEQALPTLIGRSIKCEFIDDERTELCGHGETDIEDGLPIYENAVMIGVFDKGYIQDIETEEGTKTVCIGEGTIDAECYNNFCKKLDADIAAGNPPHGSVEIQRTNGNDSILYKYGYKDKGRIPSIFEYSGYALLGVKPADETAKLIELNNKEENETMDEKIIQEIVDKIVSALKANKEEVNAIKKECEAKVDEATNEASKAVAEKNEIEANSKQIQKALDDVKAEFEELDEKYCALYGEADQLRKALAEAQAKERLASLTQAVSEYTDDEKAFAKEEIEAFKKDPNSVEVQEIVSKINEGIGKASHDAAKKRFVAEKNSANRVNDIYSEVTYGTNNDSDIYSY